MKILMIKQPGGVFVPASETEADKTTRFKNGSFCEFEVKQKRNGPFHRKFFAMLNVGFDAFEPGIKEHKGMPVQKNFDRFRKDVIAAAGFYDVVVNINGDVRAEAHSISFSKASEEEFEKIYSAVCNVLLLKVLRNYTRDDLDSVVEQIIRF